MVTLPQIAVFDIVLGLASAVLLILALFYIARSRHGASLTLAAPARADDAVPMFQPVAAHEAARGLSFIGSLFLHMLGIALVPWIEIAFPDALVPRHYSNELVLLEYRIPDIPLVTPGDIEELTKQEREKPEEETAPKSAAAAAKISAEPAPAAEEKPSAEPAPKPALKMAPKKQREVFKPVFKVVLPEIAPSDPALKDVILQPDLALEFPRDYAPQLPPVLAWTPDPRKLENAQLVDPGHKVPDTVDRWELPDTEPQLLAPNTEASLADLQIDPNPVVSEDPVLPMPTAAVSPLQGVAPPEEALPQLPVLSDGDSSTALVALNQEPNPLSPAFLLEMGLRLGTIDNTVEVPSGAADHSADGASAAAVEGELASVSDSVVEGGEVDGVEAEGAVDGSKTAEALAAAPNAVGGPDAEGNPSTESASAEGGDPEGDGRAVEVAENAGGDGSGEGLEDDPAASGQPGESEDGTEGPGTEVASAAGDDPSGTGSGEESGTGGGGKKTGLKPLPRRQYGIILVSNAQTNFREMNGVLKGSPIYTVHLDVPEAPRKWTLQFCIPDSGKRQLDVSSGVIRIRPRKKVAPPFPREKKALRLEETSEPNPGRPSSVMVYATVDEEGALGNLKMVRGADPRTDNIILAHLRSWEFLPAFRGEEPILVEALFGIPLP